MRKCIKVNQKLFHYYLSLKKDRYFSRSASDALTNELRVKRNLFLAKQGQFTGRFNTQNKLYNLSFLMHYALEY